MAEYYIVANSFAAPFFSDTSARFVEASSPEHAVSIFRDSYKHPAGLYAAYCYRDANAEAKNEKPLAKWLCNVEIEKQKAIEGLSGYSMEGAGLGKFRVNDTWHEVANPKGGRFVTI